MGFTTLITINLRVGMNNKHQCKNVHIFLIMDVTMLNYKQNKYFFKLILTLKPSIGK